MKVALWLVGATVALVPLAACTETPSYFPPCVNPDLDACPPLDAGADGDADAGKKAAISAPLPQRSA
jgi:hypothetical protein